MQNEGAVRKAKGYFPHKSLAELVHLEIRLYQLVAARYLHQGQGSPFLLEVVRQQPSCYRHVVGLRQIEGIFPKLG